MLDPLQCYRIFNTTKLHFSQKTYDVRKYGLNKSRFNADNFDHKFQYEKLSEWADNNRYNTTAEETFWALCYSNLFLNPSIWCGDLLSEEAKTNYLRAIKFSQAQENGFLEDFKKLHSKYGSIAAFNAYTETMSGRINPESVVLLERTFPKFSKVLEKSCNNYVYESFLERIRKYGAFVTVPDEKFYEQVRKKMLYFCNAS